VKGYFCIEIHTERLHDDKVWEETKKILQYFAKSRIQATWFSVNPTFSGYRAMSFDETKWRERLRVIFDSGQDIQQHTHFYKGKEGVPKGEGYDVTKGNIERRIVEDRRWLELQGFSPRGFVSGAWKVNEDLFRVLEALQYVYDSSTKGRKIARYGRVLEIPVSSKLRKLVRDVLLLRLERNFVYKGDSRICVISFHDYDLASPAFRIALRFVVEVFRIIRFDFVSATMMYEKLK